jgi:hypothetical protein
MLGELGGQTVVPEPDFSGQAAVGAADSEAAAAAAAGSVDIPDYIKGKRAQNQYVKDYNDLWNASEVKVREIYVRYYSGDKSDTKENMIIKILDATHNPDNPLCNTKDKTTAKGKNIIPSSPKAAGRPKRGTGSTVHPLPVAKPAAKPKPKAKAKAAA